MPSAYETLSRDAASAAEFLSATMRKERRNRRRSGCHHRYRDDESQSSSLSGALLDIITSSDRRKMVDWCYSIVDACKLDRENVAMAMEMVDRFLSSSSHALDYLSSRSRYQLLTMGALYVSIKVTEPVAFGSDLLAETSGGLYSQKDVENMELEILTALEFRVHASPTARLQAHLILSLITPLVNLEGSTWDFVLDEVSFFAEYSVRDDYFSALPPSTTALASIFNVLDYVDRDDCREVVRALLSVMERFQLASPREIFEAKGRLERLVEADDEPANDEGDEDCMSTGVEDESSGKHENRSFPGHEAPCDLSNTSPRAVHCYR